MKIRLHFVGKCKVGPELEIFNRYLARLSKLGRSINLHPVEIVEYDERKFFAKKPVSAITSKSLSKNTVNILLDETGTNISSKNFAVLLNNIKHQGIAEIGFFVGGSRGVPKEVRGEFFKVISFGKMVWPHMLARVMLIEQLYRSCTIISGLPYHKA